jgi:drug/metabolite transporter (DMT)-like permease
MTSEPSTMTAPRLVGLKLAYALFLLFFIGIGWGSTYSIAKYVTEAGMHPFGMTLWQGLGGGVVLLGLCLIRRKLPPVTVSHVRFYALCGLLGTAVPSCVWFWIAPKLQSGMVAITGAMVPLVTLGLALAFRVERFEAKRAAGIALGLAAVLLIVLPETSLPDPAMVIWVVVSLAIPICYSSENIVLTLLRPPRIDSVALLCGMLLTGSVLMSPLVLLTVGWVDMSFPWDAPKAWFAFLIVLNAVSYFSFMELIRMTGPVFAAQEGYIITISGVIWGMIVFDEVHSPWVWAAIVVMFLGLALVTPRAAQPR